MMESQSAIAHTPIRVLVVDDEDIVRYGLKAILQREPTLEIVGEAHNGEVAIAQAQALHPDVVLMDIKMPVMDGVTATRFLLQEHLTTKVLILTTHTEDQYLVEAIQYGAVGYFLKNTPPDELIAGIQVAHKGYMQLGPTLGQKLSQRLSQPPQPPMVATTESQSFYTPHSMPTIPDSDQELTPRERDVLHLIVKGANNQEIAQRLHIAEKTVKNHVSNMLKRVGLRDRTQLAIWAITTSTVLATDSPQVPPDIPPTIPSPRATETTSAVDYRR
ncbi:MAG: response regulator transcription factor [Cyanobacteria bacterium P01_F01_bin.150]